MTQLAPFRIAGCQGRRISADRAGRWPRAGKSRGLLIAAAGVLVTVAPAAAQHPASTEPGIRRLETGAHRAEGGLSVRDGAASEAIIRAAEASPLPWMTPEDLRRLRDVSFHLAADRQESALEAWAAFVEVAYRQGHIGSAAEAAPAFDLAVRRAFLDPDAELKPLADRVRRTAERRQTASGRAGDGASSRPEGPTGEAGQHRGLALAELELRAAERDAEAAQREYDVAVRRLQSAIQMESRLFRTLEYASRVSHDIATRAIRNVRA